MWWRWRKATQVFEGHREPQGHKQQQHSSADDTKHQKQKQKSINIINLTHELSERCLLWLRVCETSGADDLDDLDDPGDPPGSDAGLQV